MLTWKMHITSSDTHAMTKQVSEDFAPFVNLVIRGHVTHNDIKVNSMIWNHSSSTFNLEMGWNSGDGVAASVMTGQGWTQVGG